MDCVKCFKNHAEFGDNLLLCGWGLEGVVVDVRWKRIGCTCRTNKKTKSRMWGSGGAWNKPTVGAVNICPKGSKHVLN
jgi:hypothetical protein